MKRTHTTTTTTTARCVQCGRTWDQANAQATAARHHDAFGHTTTVEQVLLIRYGEDAAAPDQPSMFD